MANDSNDTTMFGMTSLLSFSKFVKHVRINAVVKMVYKYKESKASHIVASGLIVSNSAAAWGL